MSSNNLIKIVFLVIYLIVSIFMIFIVFTDKLFIFIRIFPIFIIFIEFLELQYWKNFKDFMSCVLSCNKGYKFNNSLIFTIINTIYILLYASTIFINDIILIKCLLLLSLLLILKQFWSLYIMKFKKLLLSRY
jgi:hypothetical protein